MLSATELIQELLEELGEPALAKTVAKKLRNNDEAHLPIKTPARESNGCVREVTVGQWSICLEPA